MKKALVFAALLAAAPPARADWKPVDPAELALKAPLVDKDADAEALLWDVRVSDEISPYQALQDHHLRIKIFTERGAERHRQIEIEYEGWGDVRNIAARTIKADGTIVELKKEDIFERDLVRHERGKLKAKSFALPAVEPGSIVEYRWRESLPLVFMTKRLPLQRDIPVHVLRYSLKPFAWLSQERPLSMNIRAFNTKLGEWKTGSDRFDTTVLRKVPAFRPEPRMPPENQFRAWMLVYYLDGEPLPPEKFWREMGREVYKRGKGEFAHDATIREAAAKATLGATSDADKVERLYRFCRSAVKRAEDDALELTPAQREELEELDERFRRKHSAREALARGFGSDREIVILFGALASAAGFETRLAAAVSRSDYFFDETVANDYAMRYRVVAVRVGTEWRIFDPSAPYTPSGMLRWRHEGIKTLISDPKEPLWATPPIAVPAQSGTRRTARFKLTPEGALEGDIRTETFGHEGADDKEYLDDLSAEARVKEIEDELERRLGGGEVTGVTIENVTDPERPLVVAAKVRLAGYAQRTGKRLFLQPGFFQRGRGALFPNSERKYPMYFAYPWSEEDTVTVELPPGFALESADAPAPISGGEAADYRVKITAAGTALTYTRSLFFGGKSSIIYPVASYPAVKQFFDAVHQSDQHTLALKESSAPAR